MELNALKRKLLCLIERIKLSESEYRAMKAKSQMYDGMMSSIKWNTYMKEEEVKNNNGDIIWMLPKEKTVTMEIDIVDMLANGGITFDKNAVELKVTGI